MHWIEPATSDDSHAAHEKKLRACPGIAPGHFSDAGGISPCSRWSSEATPPDRDPTISAPRQGCQPHGIPVVQIRLNLAVHGLSGEWSGATWTLPPERPQGERGGAHQIKQGNTYYEDLSDEDFKEKLEALNEELKVLKNEARELEARMAENVSELLES